MTDERWTDEREIRISAEPEAVWAAWAEPDHVRRWFSDDARGELEAGGELVHEFDGHGEHRYQVVEVDAPRRLVLEGEMDGRAFRQEVEIRSEGGSTVLRLVHSGFGSADPDSEIVQGIDSGWTMALAAMRHYVEQHFGKEKAMVSIFRPGRFDYEDLQRRYYLDGEGLSQWLTEDDVDLRSGEPVRLTIRGGHPLSGSILAVTDHEVSLAWEELDGLLELKAFGSGPDARILGVRLITWSDDTERVAAVRASLEEAVERLLNALPMGASST
ncbi:MAG: SRPBCC domain-containing protein [Longimicrobiales bacterium]|nr:SRPBCC domain-containing protein [Longimicrobiales bacterium]